MYNLCTIIYLDIVLFLTIDWHLISFCYKKIYLKFRYIRYYVVMEVDFQGFMLSLDEFLAGLTKTSSRSLAIETLQSYVFDEKRGRGYAR